MRKAASTKAESTTAESAIRPKQLVRVSKSGNPGAGPNSYFLYYIFIKALILIKFEHNA